MGASWGIGQVWEYGVLYLYIAFKLTVYAEACIYGSSNNKPHFGI
jgi:hypothetical protein